MYKILLAALVIALSSFGCATSPMGSVASGGASYGYANKTYDNTGKVTKECSVQITSAREVTDGSITIGSDCSVKSNAGNLGGVDATIKVIQSLVDRVPTLPIVP